MNDVPRFAAAVCLLNRHRQTVHDLLTLAEALGRANLVAVEGERALAVGLLVLLTRADDEIDSIRSTPNGDAGGSVAKLEELVHLPEWAVAERAFTRLDEQRTAQQEVIRLLTNDLGTYQQAVREVRHEVEATVLAGGEVDPEIVRAVAELDGVIGEAARQATDGRYDFAAVAVKKTKDFELNGVRIADPAQFDVLLKQIRDNRTETQKRDTQMALRAELFVMLTETSETERTYRVLLRRPVGAGSAQETSFFSDRTISLLDRDRFQAAVAKIANQAAAGIRKRTARHVELDRSVPDSVLPDAVDRMRTVGKQLYQLLVPDDMRFVIDQTTCALRVTSSDLELPWELMHDHEDFLSVRRPLARMPVGRGYRMGRPTTSPSDTRWQVLLIHSDPEGTLPDAATEIEEIRRLLADRPELPVEITILPPAEATFDNVSNELVSGRYDLIHYAGHAGYVDDPADCHLVLHEKKKFPAQRIQDLLVGTPVVFLNACDSGAISNEQPHDDQAWVTTQEAQGLASAFVYAGAPACVGALWPVFDDTARTLATSFYKLLFSRRRVGDALCEARMTARRRNGDATTWAAYALYGDPAYQLRGAKPPSEVPQTLSESRL